MRTINEIIFHCSATPEGKEFSAQQIRGWHLQRGFSDIGYHVIVHLDGSIERGRPLHIAGAHTNGHNANSIGVCYIGGVDEFNNPKDTRTPAQRETLRAIAQLARSLMPGIKISGHREYARKACPCFDVIDLL